MEHDYAGAVVNLDILFLVNWMMDCLILLLVRAVLFPKVSVKKTAAGAFVQAVTYVVWLVFRGDMSECIAAFLAILLVALPLQWTFSIRKPRIFLKTVTAAAGFAFLLGGFGFFVRKELMKTGIIAAAGQGIFTGVMLFFALGLNVFLKKKRKWMQTAEKREDNIYEVEIQRKKRVIVLKGLYDSGNLLISRWNGRGICVISAEDAEKLMDTVEQERMRFLLCQKEFPWKIMVQQLWSGFYRIAYSSVGTSDQWMPGILADRIIVKKDGRIYADVKGLLGIAKGRISEQNEICALLPADIFEP